MDLYFGFSPKDQKWPSRDQVSCLKDNTFPPVSLGSWEQEEGSQEAMEGLGRRGVLAQECPCSAVCLAWRPLGVRIQAEGSIGAMEITTGWE
jgi:hypothetical protein